MMSNNKRGFTLIELLVVVLIIAILAAVALPQYNKAVEKARLAEAFQVLSSFQKAMDMYILENGLPASSTVIFTGEHPDVELDIDFNSSMVCEGGHCNSKDFRYYAECDGGVCDVIVTRLGDKYGLVIYKPDDISPWEHICETYNTSLGEGICNSITGQGWEYWNGQW